VFRPKALYVRPKALYVTVHSAKYRNVERRSQSPLAFAPIRHTRTLKQWARDPLAR
jgi:hypothetical protein